MEDEEEDLIGERSGKEEGDQKEGSVDLEIDGPTSTLFVCTRPLFVFTLFVQFHFYFSFLLAKEK